MRSGDGFLTCLSLLLVKTDEDSDWKEADRLRIEGHNPSGARPTSDRREELSLSAIESRAGVIGLEDGDEGVEGLDDGDEGLEGFDKGVEGGEGLDFGDEGAERRAEVDEGVAGLLLSADCARWGTAVLGMVEV